MRGSGNHEVGSGYVQRIIVPYALRRDRISCEGPIGRGRTSGAAGGRRTVFLGCGGRQSTVV